MNNAEAFESIFQFVFPISTAPAVLPLKLPENTQASEGLQVHEKSPSKKKGKEIVSFNKVEMGLHN